MKSTDDILLLLEEWLVVKKELNLLFDKRDKKNALEPMMKGIKIFEQFLFLSNERELTAKETTNNEEIILSFTWKPVNVIERLRFIHNRPNSFHSFIQLTELINEQEKQYKKKMAIEKMTKQ